MKILYVLPFMRVPPDFGAAIRSYHILNHLASRHSLILAAFELSDQGELVMWTKKHNMAFETLGSYPMTHIGSSEFRQLFHRIFERVPNALNRVQPKQIAVRLQQIFDAHPDIDVLILESHLTAQTLLYLKTNVPAVAVLLDVYSQYNWRKFVGAEWSPYKLVFWLDWFKAYWYERRITSRFRYLIAMSESDAAYLKALTSKTQMLISPNGVDTARHLSAERSKNHNLIMVGNFTYTPNEDGFLYFTREVLPRIYRTHPEVQLLVVGLAPTSTMIQAAQSDDHIHIIGPVPDLEPYYEQANVAIVPLQLGSGVKLKVLEAFALGVPVVTTSVGAEGIMARHGEHCLIADSPQDFASAVINLLDNRLEANILAEHALSLVRTYYDWQLISASFENFIQQIASSGRS